MSFFRNPIIVSGGGESKPLVRKRETFTATNDQTTFTVPKYEINKNKIDVLVGNVQQFAPENYTEVDSTTIRFNSPLSTGTKVHITYYE